MPNITFNMPDDFQNELLRRKAIMGQSIRFQILTMMRKEFGWPIEAMPSDGRVKPVEWEARHPKYDGHVPKNIKLDEKGLPDFDNAADGAAIASQKAYEAAMAKMDAQAGFGREVTDAVPAGLLAPWPGGDEGGLDIPPETPKSPKPKTIVPEEEF